MTGFLKAMTSNKAGAASSLRKHLLYLTCDSLLLSRYYRYSLLAACCLSLLSGCGYSLHSRASLPFHSISIGKIANKTFEPKLQDRMQTALADELMKNGFNIAGDSGHRIDGVLNTFELKTLSEKSGTAVEYEVIVKGDFRLTGPSGEIKALRGSGAFIISFTSTESLQGVVALKEQATERALRDLASEIVASIIYK